MAIRISAIIILILLLVSGFLGYQVISLTKDRDYRILKDSISSSLSDGITSHLLIEKIRSKNETRVVMPPVISNLNRFEMIIRNKFNTTKGFTVKFSPDYNKPSYTSHDYISIKCAPLNDIEPEQYWGTMCFVELLEEDIKGPVQLVSLPSFIVDVYADGELYESQSVEVAPYSEKSIRKKDWME